MDALYIINPSETEIQFSQFLLQHPTQNTNGPYTTDSIIKRWTLTMTETTCPPLSSEQGYCPQHFNTFL